MCKEYVWINEHVKQHALFGFVLFCWFCVIQNDKHNNKIRTLE